VPLAARANALEELEQVASALSQLHRELADLEAAEHTARVQSWFAHDSKYITERDRVAEYNTLQLTPEVIKVKGEIAALQSRRGYLEFLIHWGP
jgi:hypothetical protein